MACEHPLKGWRRADNVGPLRFGPMPQDGQLWWPLNVPCGNCILCREEQARQWGVRITHEAAMHEENAFITLTYSDNNLPEHNSLNYEDLQKFWKRLRHHLGPLRYYAVGEYGDKTLRPHYHACVFGHAFMQDRRLLRESPTLLWTSPMLEEAWGKGHVSVGALTFETARYTASYVTKKLRSKQTYVRINEEDGELIPLVQPRCFASRDPAIGGTWLAEFGKYVYDHDHVVINGRPQKPPKSYDRWLEKTQGKEAVAKIKEQRQKKAAKAKSQDARARAEIARARAKMKSKSV